MSARILCSWRANRLLLLFGAWVLRHCEEPTGPAQSGRPDDRLRDEAIQSGTSELDCFADARNDEQKHSRGAKASELCDHQASSNTQPLAQKKARGAERRKTHPTNVRRANMRAQRAPLVCVRGGGAPQKTSLAQRLCLRGALA